MAVASAGSYASLHLAADRQPRQHPTAQFFTGWMPFLQPNQQRQSIEGKSTEIVNSHAPHVHILDHAKFHGDRSYHYRHKEGEEILLKALGVSTFYSHWSKNQSTDNKSMREQCLTFLYTTFCIQVFQAINYCNMDTIRDAILTCTQKLTKVSLIYSMEPKTKKVKEKKN